jgi:signal transduction histidine kinase
VNSPGTILIVDDEARGRETLEALLASQGYHLLFACNGIEALALAASARPDLIMLDVMMPDMDGFEVCQRLRADPLLAEVPVLLVTALDDRDSRLQGIEVGADDFISKPFDRIELRMRVHTIVRLNRYGRLLAERMQRQQFETEISQRNQELAMLQRADRLKNQFISDVSHELRTPLSIMTLLTGNLEALYDRLTTPKRRMMIHDIRQHTRMLNELIDNVLNITRLDNCESLPERSRVDLAQLLHQELDKQAPLISKKAQVLCSNGLAQLEVIGCADLLRQALCNLLNNAIKYTPNGGQITCECWMQRIIGAPNRSAGPGTASLAGGTWATLSISDTGIGIKPDDVPHIFDRFYRVNPQGSIPGTGLGLAIVQEIINLHAGRIVVDSTPGEGSRFVVYLPVFEEELSRG